MRTARNFLLRKIKFIFSFVMALLFLPFKLTGKFSENIIKRFKFSITFKITASYFLLYMVIIIIVTVTTSTGYFVYTLTKVKKDIMEPDMSYIESNFEDIFKIDQIVDGVSINGIYIYDDNLNRIYASDDAEVRYSNNIIVTIENLIKKKQYMYASYFVKEGRSYYVNIQYSITDMLSESWRINFIIFVSGLLGLFVFIPIVSRMSYKIIRPIKNMTEITKTISVNNINTRLDLKDTQDELKELSQTFNAMMDRIEEGYKSQQQFVSDASHELRTPIAVMKGYVNMLDRWGKNDKAILDESIQAIKNETDSMQDLIEKLLFIARSDKQTLVFTKEDFKICEILFEIEKESMMIDKKHEFIFKFYDDVNVYADKNRIKQSIRIFIENAIKFTPEKGYISVIGYTEEDYYIIRISDTGIGIDKKDLGKIFDRLYRAEESRSKEIGGHGLGLAIAKIIVLGHKGKIKVKSTLGTGSEFFIMLPYLGAKH